MAEFQGHGEDKTISDRIMLRFRPIAPKPASGGSLSVNASSETRNLVSTPKRVKRKYVRVQKNSNVSRAKSRARSCEEEPTDPTVVTLQLFPENIEHNDSHREDNRDPLMLLNIEISSEKQKETDKESDRKEGIARGMKVAVLSWVTVECVTGTCCMEGLLGCSTDVNMKNYLDMDTCPVFISDGKGRVGWVNAAYKRLVVSENNGDERPSLMEYPEVIVWLTTKAKLPDTTAFSCLVRLEKEKKWSKMVPCDVWRMEFGRGLAWRLDVKAALGLAL